MIAHERHEHLQDVVDVLVFVHGGQVVEDGLQLVLLDPVADHGELLDEEEHVRTDRHDLVRGGAGAVWKKIGLITRDGLKSLVISRTACYTVKGSWYCRSKTV